MVQKVNSIFFRLAAAEQSQWVDVSTSLTNCRIKTRNNNNFNDAFARLIGSPNRPNSLNDLD